jgi:hypothetical protein
MWPFDREPAPSAVEGRPFNVVVGRSTKNETRARLRAERVEYAIGTTVAKLKKDPNNKDLALRLKMLSAELTVLKATAILGGAE